MTRMLSELLGAKEPEFRLSLRQLEKSAGHPSADIRHSVDILHRSFAKIRELGLDPQNTTEEELYQTLKQRLLADEQRLRDALDINPSSTTVEITTRLEKFIDSLDVPKNCFALKFSVAKKILKNNPPQKAMKRLGYRSLDSMLKHEPVPQIYAAAVLYESARWHKELHEAYDKLSPSDFEVRSITILAPKSRRWLSLANDFISSRRQNNLAFKELGSLVLLPTEEKLPALLLATTLFSIKNINEVRCTSSFLKLQQVKPDFGKIVSQSIVQEPFTQAEISGFKLPWRFLHEFFGNSSETADFSVLEPHVQSEDLRLAKSEEILAKKFPALEFWVGTEDLAFIENGRPVSFNMLDVAINVVNDLAVEQSVAHRVRERVWQSLLTRYLEPRNLESVSQQLNAELTGEELESAPEMEIA